MIITIKDATPPPIEFGIIHTFEFISALRRMSVIVRKLASPTMEVFVKGAPEVMKDICTADSSKDKFYKPFFFFLN